MDQVTVSRWRLRQVLDEMCVTANLMPAYTALRAALEQPVQQPYGWHVTGCNELLRGEYAQSDAELAAKRCGGTAKAVAVYTAPQAQQPAPVQE